MQENNSSQSTCAEHETRTVKCSDTCQHNIKFVLIFTKKDLTLVETCAVALNFGLMSNQSENCTGQYQKWSENVRCPGVILCSVCVYSIASLYPLRSWVIQIMSYCVVLYL